LQRIAAVIGDFDRRQLQLAAVIQHQRTAVAHGDDVCGADRGQPAAFLRCRIAHNERLRGGSRDDGECAGRTEFHGC